MQVNTQTAPVSQKMLWAGRIVSALPVLMLLFSGIMQVMKPAPVVQVSLDMDTPRGLSYS